jgi:hypothetical protein
LDAQAFEMRFHLFLNLCVVSRYGRRNPYSLTLRTAIDTEQIILRANIKTLQSTGLSLMPPGLEAALPPAAMADLLAYLHGE